MKVLECDYGKLEYRLPNIPEAMELLGLIGLNSTIAADVELISKNEFIYIAQVIKHMEKFIKKVDIKIGNKKITKYEDLMTHFEMVPHLSQIASEIMNALNPDKKK